MNFNLKKKQYLLLLFTLVNFTFAQAQDQISIPYIESFENGLGLFSQDNTDNFDWERIDRGSVSEYTGPPSAYHNNCYLHTVAHENYNKTAILNLNTFTVENTVTELYISFAYHMFGGAAMGTLKLQIKENNTWTTIWSRSGNQGNAWHLAEIDLQTYLEHPIELRFSGTIGNGWGSYMAIDRVIIKKDNTAPGVSNTKYGELVLNANKHAEWSTKYTEEMSLPTLIQFLATKALRVGSETNIVTEESGELISIRYGASEGEENKRILIFEIAAEPEHENFLIRMQYGDTDHDNSGLTDLSGNVYAGNNAINGTIDTSTLSIGNFAQQSLSVYPNPVTTTIHVKNSIAKEATYTIRDFTGKQIKKSKGKGTEHNIDVSQLAPGVYLLEATTEKQKTQWRFVKK